MKNLLIYINPAKNFGNEVAFRSCDVLVKIQIDNSLSLGWKAEDILLFTNFDYHYNGVNSITLNDDLYCSFRPLSTKTAVVAHLLENGLLEKNKIYWVHDFDAYQLNPIQPAQLELDTADFGFTDYGWSSKPSLGSYFVKQSAKDIFTSLRETIYKHELEDERAFRMLTENNTDNINGRIKKLNITYNFGMRNIGASYTLAQKPLRVLHFHPYYNDTQLHTNTIRSFMYGKNELNKPLMTERLIKIFNHHGIV
jgi:hypothetical protein